MERSSTPPDEPAFSAVLTDPALDDDLRQQLARLYAALLSGEVVNTEAVMGADDAEGLRRSLDELGAATWRPAPLPAAPADPDTCPAWCAIGHPFGEDPDSDPHYSPSREVPLSREPAVDMYESSVLLPEVAKVYVAEGRTDRAAVIQVGKGDLAESFNLTPDEAESLGRALIDAARTARSTTRKPTEYSEPLVAPVLLPTGGSAWGPVEEEDAVARLLLAEHGVRVVSAVSGLAADLWSTVGTADHRSAENGDTLALLLDRSADGRVVILCPDIEPRWRAGVLSIVLRWVTDGSWDGSSVWCDLGDGFRAARLFRRAAREDRDGDAG